MLSFSAINSSSDIQTAQTFCGQNKKRKRKKRAVGQKNRQTENGKEKNGKKERKTEWEESGA